MKEKLQGVSMRHEIEDGNIRVRITGARLSFPALFEPDTFGGGDPRYKATFLLDESDPQVAELRELVKEVKARSSALKGKKLGADKICLRDGNDKDYDGYEGCWYVTAANKRQPQVVGPDNSPIGEGGIYAGCYVNCVIRMWPQSDANGKRINSALEIVQFARDGERFGGSLPDTGDWMDAEDGTVDNSDDGEIDEDEI